MRSATETGYAQDEKKPTRAQQVSSSQPDVCKPASPAHNPAPPSETAHAIGFEIAFELERRGAASKEPRENEARRAASVAPSMVAEILSSGCSRCFVEGNDFLAMSKAA